MAVLIFSLKDYSVDNGQTVGKMRWPTPARPIAPILQQVLLVGGPIPGVYFALVIEQPFSTTARANSPRHHHFAFNKIPPGTDPARLQSTVVGAREASKEFKLQEGRGCSIVAITQLHKLQAGAPLFIAQAHPLEPDAAPLQQAKIVLLHIILETAVKIPRLMVLPILNQRSQPLPPLILLQPPQQPSKPVKPRRRLTIVQSLNLNKLPFRENFCAGVAENRFQ